MTVVCCYGTRPEFIKIAPIVLELKRHYPSIKPILVCSGQHEELLAGLDTLFGVHVDQMLDIRDTIGSTDSLPFLAEAAHTRFALALESLKPDGVLVQGDAASSFLAAFAAFHLHIPVFYVEAGLRTYDLGQPFPEEAYRQLTSRLANFCFAPTEGNKKNLLNERMHKDSIFVTGNTIVDAVEFLKKKIGTTMLFSWLKTEQYHRLILVTIHRRENQGRALQEMLKALVKVQKDNPDDLFVFSVHPNPKVRLVVYDALKNNSRFVLIPPPKYLEFLSLLSRSSAVMTDSGGIQEEAPSFGVPVLVLRNKTERIESVQEGWSAIAGTDEGSIMKVFKWLETWKKPKTVNPYGDGKASERIAKIIYEQL